MMSPSKTYNLAGIACAFAIIPDAKLRSGLIAASRQVYSATPLIPFCSNSMLTTHIFYLNEYRGFVQQMSPLSYTAVQAAYSAQAEEWRLQLLQYLTQNR
jgi:cystathionine beta-lyase